MNKDVKITLTARPGEDKIENLEDLKTIIQRTFEENFKYTPATKSNIEPLKNAINERIQEYKSLRGKGPEGSFYRHDCQECSFLGGFLDSQISGEGVVNVSYYDLYAHKRESRLELISRYGDNGEDYISISLFYENGRIIYNPVIQRIPSLNEAFKRYIKTTK